MELENRTNAESIWPVTERSAGKRHSPMYTAGCIYIVLMCRPALCLHTSSCRKVILVKGSDEDMCSIGMLAPNPCDPLKDTRMY